MEMGKMDVLNMERAKVGELDLADSVFHAPVREHLFWEVVKWQLAGRRAGTHSTLGRSDVSGSTRKLFRQKGTGRARRGSIKSHVLRGGAVAFGPKPRNYSYSLPKRVRREALIAALSKRVADGHFVVLDNLELPEFKTRRVADLMKRFGWSSVLFVDQDNRRFNLAGRNIPKVKVLPVMGLNVFDILKHDHLVLTRQAVAAVEGRLSK
jgi:large subunit ribosomal protein L4